MGNLFLDFIVPIFALGILAEIYGFIFLYILFGIDFILITIFGFPMLTLIARGVYNNVEFQRFNPDQGE